MKIRVNWSSGKLALSLNYSLFPSHYSSPGDSPRNRHYPALSDHKEGYLFLRSRNHMPEDSLQHKQ